MILSLWFPNWPIQRLRGRQWKVENVHENGPSREHDDAKSNAPAKPPLLLYAAEKNALRVTARCRVAEEAGVSIGMPLAEARVVLGDDVETIEHDIAADADRLRELAVICRRFSPMCGVDGWRDGLLLDITGCGHLFGGEEQLAAVAVTHLATLSYRVEFGLGASVGRAWAAARYPNARDRLDDLPIEALRVDGKAVAGLADFDLRTVGQLRRLPREQLPSRFGDELLRRLDQFDGRLPEPFEPVLPTETLQVSWSTEHPLRQPNLVNVILERLLGDLVTKLPESVGITKLCVVIQAESDELAFNVAFVRPTIEAKRLVELVSLRRERTITPGDVERVTVEANGLDLIRKSQTDLFGDQLDGEADRDWLDLVERLTGRLGADSVSYARLTPDPLPERVIAWSPAMDGSPCESPAAPPPLFTRPVILLSNPIRLHVWVFDRRPFRVEHRGRTIDVVQAWGPERVESGWWRGVTDNNAIDQCRDYYRLELTCGECLWTYWDAAREQWWLHGLL